MPRIPFTIDSIFAGQSEKTCSKCQETLSITKFCKRGDRDALRSWCNSCLYVAHRVRIKKDPKKRNRYQNDYNQKLKRQVMSEYSDNKVECACCGENNLEFLAIDHINGGGNKERRALNINSGVAFYSYLKRNNYPDGYRVLCHNCNMSLGMFKYCPHNKTQI